MWTKQNNWSSSLNKGGCHYKVSKSVSKYIFAKNKNDTLHHLQKYISLNKFYSNKIIIVKKHYYKHSQDDTHLQPGVVFTSVVLRLKMRNIEHRPRGKILLINSRRDDHHSSWQAPQNSAS